MSLGQSYIDDISFSFRKYKEYADKAIQQLQNDEVFFHQPAAESNSIALIVKHLAGNLKARFTDLLTSDGEKPWRDRDGEFVIGPSDSRAALLNLWEESWGILLNALTSLREKDLLKTVPIRGEPHTVLQALDRALAHTAYHVGQIVYLAKLFTQEGWRWITIPPGKSKAQGGKYLAST